MVNTNVNRHLFFACIGLGLLFHFFFYEKEIGVSIPIYIGFLYTVYFWQIRGNMQQSRFEWFLFVSIILLSFTFTLISQGFLLFLNALVLCGLIFLHTIHHFRQDHHVLLIFGKMLVETCSHFVQIFIGGLKKMTATMDEQTVSVTKKILLGMFISLPFLFIVINLLASADETFMTFLNTIPNWLVSLQFGEVVGRILLVLFVSFSTFAYFLSIRKGEKVMQGINRPKYDGSYSIDSIILVTVLVMLNIVYSLYMIVQFSYFFEGDPSKTAFNLTYAEYARKGFTELTFVTMINLGLVVGTIIFHQKGSKFMNVLINISLTLLVSFTSIMLFSAFQRLFLYEQAYGFTYARIFAHAFMIVLGFLFVISYLKIWFEKIKLIRSSFVVIVICLTGLNYMNVTSFIVEKNIERYHETGKLDTAYLYALSFEAIPPLIELYEQEQIYHIGVFLKDKKRELSYKQGDWQGFNFATYRAKQLLEDWEK
ncbi:DUF4173 domain-containing protein [Bacillus timonensis]|nr:DUF4173 domain-containing protein [Bacillus timonensis]